MRKEQIVQHSQDISILYFVIVNRVNTTKCKTNKEVERNQICVNCFKLRFAAWRTKKAPCCFRGKNNLSKFAGIVATVESFIIYQPY